MQQLLQQPSWESLRRLCAWAKLVLRAPGKEGKGNLDLQVQRLAQQAAEFSSLDLGKLWESRKENVHQPRRTRGQAKKDRIQDERWRKKIKTLVSEGQPAQAMRLLTSVGSHDLEDPRIHTILRDLHPAENAIQLIPCPEVHRLKFSEDTEAQCDRLDTLLRCVKSFSTTSAAGPSGLKAAHLKDMLATKQHNPRRKLLMALDALTTRALSGNLPQVVATTLGAARLIALRKETNKPQTATPMEEDGGTSEGEESKDPEPTSAPTKKDVRPIAIGETLRRLIGKVSLTLPQTKAALASLQPAQQAVGAKRGAEQTAMLLQQSLLALEEEKDDQTWCVLKVDLSNAFNAVSRQRIIVEVGKQSPHLLQWVQSLYGKPLTLYMGTQKVASTRGVQQGCNFGTFLFALAIQPIITALPELWINRWYADDGLLIGPRKLIEEAMMLMKSGFQQIGLEVNVQKCEVWGPGAKEDDKSGEDNPLTNCVHIPLDEEAGMLFLGCPIHAKKRYTAVPAFVQSWWKQKISAMKGDIQAICNFGDAHIQHLLLTTTLTTSKVEHALRASDTRLCDPYLRDMKQTILNGIQKTMGATLSDDQQVQAFLPTREGGMGYRDPTSLWASCKLAAASAYLRAVREDTTVPEKIKDLAPVGCYEAIEHLKQHAEVGQLRLQAWGQNLKDLSDTEEQETSSSLWNRRLATTRAKKWRPEGTARDKARKELLDEHSMSWTNIPPAAARAKPMGHQEFRLLSKWYMGCEVIPDAHVGCPCPKCGKPLDAWGDHLVSCTMNGITQRHCLIQDRLMEIFRRAGYAVTKEESLSRGDRPADLLVQRWEGKGPAAMDLTCVHPLRLGDNATTTQAVSQALKKAGEDKEKKYSAACERSGWKFIPLVTHPFSGWHGEAKKVLRHLVQKCAKEAGDDPTVEERNIWAELAYTQAEAVGNMLATSLDAGYHESRLPKRPRMASRADEAGNHREA